MSGTTRRWWDTACVYQIYVRSLADGNGDGVGDLAGIRSHLGDIAALGVDAVWLTPCYPSPQKDHGYDVADYFDIEPAYGDLDEFDALVADAHELGLRVLMDVVPNHCSSEHPWFRAAVAAGRGSPERERFFFRDGRGPDGSEPPNNWMSMFGGSAWERITEPDGRPGQWYLHTFAVEQPDFDWTSADVQEHFDAVLTFWFDRGVDGFRVDAVTVVGKAPGLPDAPPIPAGTKETDVAARNPYTVFRPEGQLVWRRWRRVVEDYERAHPGRDVTILAEAYAARRPEVLAEYVNATGFRQGFAFDLLLSPWHAPSVRADIDGSLLALRAVGALPTWTLNNHDVQRSATRYGRADATDPLTWTGNGMINSIAPVDLGLGLRRSRAMLVAMLALPGSAFLYQGEELGLPEVLDLPAAARQDPVVGRSGGRELGRDGCRVPVPWTDDVGTNFGFSAPSPTGGVAPAWLPQPAGWGRWAASHQRHDESSTLALYRAALACRQKCAEAMGDDFDWIDDLGDEAVAFTRGPVLVVLNLAGRPLPLPADGVVERRVVLSSVHGHHDASVVPADTALWLS